MARWKDKEKKVTHKELKFENLLKEAFSEWPSELKLDLEDEVLEEVRPTNKGYDIYRYKTVPWTGNLEEYVVKDLYDLREKIEDPYYNTQEGVIWIHLHDAIYSVIRKLSLYATNIVLKNLRLEMVQQKFETLLKEILEDPGSGDWRPQDIDLIEKYFSANSSQLESKGASPKNKL